MSEFFIGFIATFLGGFIAVPILQGILQLFGFYTIVNEGECRVYTLFGKVIGVLREPGIHFLWGELGPQAFIMPFVGGRCYVVDMRFDQVYLRSQPVNSEEGAPMGIGVWYEMFVSDPVNFLFKNTDPQGSLAANVSSAAVRCLSNMPLAEMLQTRHAMSQTVRSEVSPKSHEWGYQLGSVYIRKVHLRDQGMIRQIEEKVVNRLRQVTSAIKQDGANQVNIITSSAEREAAVAFGEAAARRPTIVGNALQEISKDGEVLEAMFEILRTQRMVESHADIVLVPEKCGVMAQIQTAGAIPAEVEPTTPPLLPAPGLHAHRRANA